MSRPPLQLLPRGYRSAALALASWGVAACEPAVELDGIVVSQLDGTPVRGVSIVHVADKTVQLGTTSDDGCFAYTRVHDRSNRRRQIQFSARGYATASVTIPASGASRVRVVLTPDMVGSPSRATIEPSDTPLPCGPASQGR